MPNDDPWGTSTGLYTDFSGIIEDSHFGTDARYNNGETTLLLWKIKPTDIEVTTEDGMIELAYPVGSGWFSYDGGETIEHTEGKAKINSNAVYGKIIDWALEQGLGDNLRKVGTPLDSKVWNGLGFRFEEVSFNYGGEIGTKKRVMPVEITSADVQAVTATDEMHGFGDQLAELASNSPDAESFTEAALALTDITDHASLVTRIADGSLFDELKG